MDTTYLYPGEQRTDDEGVVRRMLPRGSRSFAILALLFGVAALLWYGAGQRTAVRREPAQRTLRIVTLAPTMARAPVPLARRVTLRHENASAQRLPRSVPRHSAPKREPATAAVAASLPAGASVLQSPVQAMAQTTAQPDIAAQDAPATDARNFDIGDGAPARGEAGAATFDDTAYKRRLVELLAYAVEHDGNVQAAGGTRPYQVGVNLWLTRAGAIERVSIGRSTGNPQLDRAVMLALRTAGGLDLPPPARWSYPLRLNLQGREAG